MKEKVELHIIIDEDGVRGVQIIGPTEVHPEGHDMYFKIRGLISELDYKITRLLEVSGGNGDEDSH